MFNAFRSKYQNVDIKYRKELYSEYHELRRSIELNYEDVGQMYNGKLLEKDDVYELFFEFLTTN